MNSRHIAKRVFTVLLTIGLALILFLTTQEGQLNQLYSTEHYSLQNDTLYVQRRGDGVVYIGGVGMLYGQDMLALLNGDKEGVTDIVLGDEITQLGYGAIDGFENLRSLWLGRNLISADNASVRATEALKVAFIPATLKRVGRDFLYGNRNCVVVTNAAEEDLPKLKNVKKTNVLAQIDSCEALDAAWPGEQELPDAVWHWWD